MTDLLFRLFPTFSDFFHVLGGWGGRTQIDRPGTPLLNFELGLGRI